MSDQFKNQVAVVTGAASGLGFAIAKRLAGEGAQVAMCDMLKAPLNKAAKQIGANAKAYQLDVTDETWGAKAVVMKENIEHHIEEEEGDMFKQARQVFDGQELTDLGARMAARKTSAQRELGIPVSA